MRILDLFARFGHLDKHEENEIFSEIDKKLPIDKQSKIANLLGAEYSDPPRIALIGLPGVGKSTTINSLFSPIPPCNVGDVVATTKEIREITVDLQERGKLIVIDCPGIGESLATDEIYTDLYRNELASCDVALWIIQADTRNYSEIQRHIRDVMPDFLKERLVIGINQIDKMEPGNWNNEYNVPSQNQLENIEAKITDVKNKLLDVGIKTEHIVAYSAKRNYKLARLFTAMLKACPQKAWVIDGRKMIVNGDPLSLNSQNTTTFTSEWQSYAESHEQSIVLIKNVLIELYEKFEEIVQKQSESARQSDSNIAEIVSSLQVLTQIVKAQQEKLANEIKGKTNTSTKPLKGQISKKKKTLTKFRAY